MGHKHVELTNYFVAGVDGNGNPITGKEHAVMDVPDEQLSAFLAEAGAPSPDKGGAPKWQSVSVTDECPEHCVAQLTTPEAHREARVAKATALREKATKAEDEGRAKFLKTHAVGATK